MRGKLASQRRSFLSKPRSSQVSLEKGTYKPSQGPGGTERGADALQTDSVPRLNGKERKGGRWEPLHPTYHFCSAPWRCCLLEFLQQPPEGRRLPLFLSLGTQLDSSFLFTLSSVISVLQIT